METESDQIIDCPECGALVGERRTSGHLRWLYCGNCEASWRAAWARPGGISAGGAPTRREPAAALEH